ncbi:MAG: ABC transporter substrate-binding protein [Chloroflexota bacterium]
MNKVFRIVALAMVTILVLGLLIPAMAQDDIMDFSSIEAGCEYGGNISSIEAVDELTVVFTLCNPDPAFPSKAAFAALGIHPSEYLVATGGGGPELFENPIGTGPYMLEEWDKGNQIVMTRNDNYWGEPAVEGTLIFRWNSEASVRTLELQAGEADAIDNPGVDDFALLEADDSTVLLERPGTNIFYVGINNTIAPFDNVLVRQAVAHAIDRQRLVDNFYPPGSSAASQFMPPSIFGFTPEVEAFPYDPDRARELLAEAGVELPIETTISYRDVVRSYLPTPGLVAVDIQAQLAEVGINVEIMEMESGAFLDAADAGELSLHLLGWGADYPDATNFLDFHFGAGASDQFGDKFDEITGPLTQGAQIADQDARYDIYIEANTAIRDLVPMVPIAHGGSGVAYRAEIENANVSPLGNEVFAVVSDPSDDEFVWVQNAEPNGLYCADETDGESLRACEQIVEALLAYEVGGTAVIPALATDWSGNEDSTVWTFNLREGVTFHDGSAFDAQDVVASYAVQLDAGSPLHVGRNGSFTYFSAFFNGFLNAPEE